MMTKTVQDAYRIVYNDILNKDIGLFLGKFDAKHGDFPFMFGIETVMEFIAKNVSDEDGKDFTTLFIDNLKASAAEAEG